MDLYSHCNSYNGVTKHDFTKEILDRIYCVPDSPSVDHIHPHRLSVFFSVMAIGVSRSFEPTAVQQAEMYYVLACSALSLCPLISEAMVATVQAVFLVNAFLCTSTRVSTEESWLLIGLCGRLAFRVGILVPSLTPLTLWMFLADRSSLSSRHCLSFSGCHVNETIRS